MNDRTRKIAVIDGANADDVYRTLLDRWPADLRVAGVVAQDHGLADRACSAGYLRSLGSGELFPIFEDLGPGSVECHLEGAGALTAVEAVRRDIANGCDLVLLSKFGKLEANGAGLRDAFSAAMDAGIPVLTSVSPRFQEAWERFAPSMFVLLPPDPDRVEEWRRAASRSAA